MAKAANNPAARLLEFVNKARGIPGNINIGDAWARVLELERSNLPGILAGITDIIQLTQEARSAIENLDDLDHSLYLQPIDRVLAAFTIMRFEIDWGQIVNQFDDKTLYGLSICSDILSKYSKEKPVSDEELKALLENVRSLQEEILRSELPEELRTFLLEQTEKLRSALMHYRVFGTKRLRQALESITGAVIFKGPEIAPFWDTPVLKRVREILAQVANVVTVTQGFEALSSGFQKLLGSG